MVAMAASTSLGKNHITTIQQATSHIYRGEGIFTIWLAGLQSSALVISATKLFMVGFLADDRLWPREVDAGVGHQVGLEFCQVNIQAPSNLREADGGHNLAVGNKVSVGMGARYRGFCTDVGNGLIVYHEGTISASRVEVRMELWAQLQLRKPGRWVNGTPAWTTCHNH